MVRAYIHNLLVITKENVIDHLKAIEIFLQKLTKEILKVNA